MTIKKLKCNSCYRSLPEGHEFKWVKLALSNNRGWARAAKRVCSPCYEVMIPNEDYIPGDPPLDTSKVDAAPIEEFVEYNTRYAPQIRDNPYYVTWRGTRYTGVSKDDLVTAILADEVAEKNGSI